MCCESASSRRVSHPSFVYHEALEDLTTINSPVHSTWLGGCRLANNREELTKVAITRQEYQEYGSGWAGRRFAGII